MRAAGRIPYLTIGPWSTSAQVGTAIGPKAIAWFQAHITAIPEARRGPGADGQVRDSPAARIGGVVGQHAWDQDVQPAAEKRAGAVISPTRSR